MYTNNPRIRKPYGGRPATNGDFEVTRVHKDQQSGRDGCSVFLRFSLTGPPGVHPIRAKISSASGTCPQIRHDPTVSLDDGATGYVAVALDFAGNAPEPCALSLKVGHKLLGRFLVQPSNLRASA